MPDAVSDERALFVGDVLTTGVYAASLADAGPDDAVAIVGAGPVGFCVAQALRAAGARRVFGLDRDAARLALIERAGATPVDVGTTNPEMELARATDGRGADVVVDAVGTPEAWSSALDIVRRGGRVVVVGMYTSETVELQLGVAWIRGLDLRFAGETPVHAWWGRAMDGLVDGELDPGPLISHRLPLAEAARGLRGVRPSGRHQGGARPVGLIDRPDADPAEEHAGFRALVEGLLEANLGRVPARAIADPSPRGVHARRDGRGCRGHDPDAARGRGARPAACWSSTARTRTPRSSCGPKAWRCSSWPPRRCGSGSPMS